MSAERASKRPRSSSLVKSKALKRPTILSNSSGTVSSVALTTPVTAGTGPLLAFSLARGGDDDERVGTSVRLNRITYDVGLYTTEDNVPTFATMWWIYDAMPRAQLPADTDIVEAASAFSLPNQSFGSRFSILKRETRQLVATATNDDKVDCMARFVGSVSCRGRRAVYTSTSTTGAITAIIQGAVYVMIKVSAGGAGTSSCQVLGGAQLQFEDV